MAFGYGTVFAVVVVCLSRAAGGGCAMVAARANAIHEPYSLLITDDDRGYLDALRTTFEPQGYRTHLAVCGTEAIEIAQSHVVHAAIMDMEMPDLTGLETIEIITRVVGEQLPFVIITGDNSEEMMFRALSAHAYSLVPKPFNVFYLSELVDQMIRKFYG
jgi:two-component system chemotaxis response regulator CheY